MNRPFTSRVLAVAMAVGVGLMAGRAEAQVPVWTPTNLPNKALWLDASDSNSMAIAGGTVSQWNDKSGLGRNLTQGTGSKQPTYTTNALNGLSALSFNSANNQSLYASSATINLSAPIYRFIVCKFLTKANQSVVFDSNTSANQFVFYNGESGSQWVIACDSAYVKKISYGTTDFTNHIHYSCVNSASSYYSIDGALTPSGPGDPGPNGMQGIQIGNIRNEAAGGYGFNGYVYEVILTTALTDANRQKVEGYLAWKWGLQANLPPGHPFKLGPPSARGGVVSYTDSNGLNPTNTPYANGYTVHTFYGSDTFSNSTATSVDVLVVGGGGGGGCVGTQGGGGGAGGVTNNTAYAVVTGSNYTVTVGAGGLGGKIGTGARNATNGSNSVFGAITALGGGNGAGNTQAAGSGNGVVGSGGGGAWNTVRGTGTPGQGNDGGAGQTSANYGQGGGGGAGSNGQNGNAAYGGVGGTGLYFAAFSSRGDTNHLGYFGGGGGGSYRSGVTAGGVGGWGGGGQGGDAVGLAGQANTGGGGGGADYNGGVNVTAGDGGSGIVIVRYRLSSALSVSVTAPTAGQVFLAGSSVTATVSVASGSLPYQAVSFYTNGVSAWSTNNTSATLFTIPLGTLGIGTYTNYAYVLDATNSTAYSSTNTFSVVAPPTSFFWTNAATAAWGTPGNWTNDAGIVMAPVTTGQTNYTLNFNSAGTYTASNNLNAGFLLNQLNFGGATATLAGNSLALTNNGASLPQVSQNSAAAVSIGNDLILGADTTFGGSGTGTVTVAGAMSGAGGLTKTGTCTLAIGSTNNAYSGASMISAGTVKLLNTTPAPPVIPGATLTLWLDARDVNGNGTTPSNGTYVPTWVNKATGGSAWGSFVVQGGGSGPTYVVNSTVLSGQPAVHFVEDHVLATPTDITGQNITMFYIGGLSGQPTVQNGRLMGSVSRNFLLGYWGNTMRANYYNGGAYSGIAVDYNAHLWVGSMSSANAFASYWASSGTGEALFDSGTGSSSPGRMALGGGSGADGEWSNGDIFEVLVYDSVLTMAQRQAVESYLNSRWSLGVTGLPAPEAAGSGTLPTNTALSVANGATFDLSGGRQIIASLSDSGGGGGVVTNSSSTSATLTINPSSGGATFSGSIRGGISLVKSGVATQILAGANVYANGTTVSNGTLLVNGSITGTVSVVSGATLGGTGAITGSVNYASGALALFTNGAPMTFTGPVTLNGNTVHLKLPDNLALGTYLLATNTSGGFSGEFAAIPVIDSGSTVVAFATNITTDANAVRLILSSSPIIVLSPSSLPDGTRAIAYSTNITASGGAAPYTNTVVSGSLPPGLSLSEGGALSGTPAAMGTYDFTVQARDALGYTGTRAYRIVIQPSAPITVYWDGPNYGGTGDGASAGGTAVWSGSVTNWDQGNGLARLPWYNGVDRAAFAGANGTVTLGESLNLGGMLFSAGTYTVSNNTLSFGAGGWITNAAQVNQTIKSGITGSPSVNIIDSSSASITFAPTTVTQTLGTCTVAYEGGISDKASMILDGTTTGNSASRIQYGGANSYGSITKQGSGTWTVGSVDIGTVYMDAGNLVVTGAVHTYYGGLQLRGGVFHYNGPGAVTADQGLNFNGAVGGVALDNSRGSAITNSTYNPGQTWGADWTFIGSQGTNSDLNLGSGAVTLGGNRSVTVSNAAATLTVGGAIGDGTQVYGLTKAGAGTLRLTGSNTYNGATTVAAGTLSLAQRCLDDTAVVTISNGAVLNLNYTGTDTVFAVLFDGLAAAAGTWGGPGSGAPNTTNLLSGTGMLYSGGGLAPAGTWYWDGPNYGGTGDGASAGGGGVWSTSSNNWDQGLVSRKVWNNTTNDKAIFRAVAGTVDLQSDITLGEILVDGVSGYVIGSTPETQSLNFGGAKKITLDRVGATIRAGITGSPQMLSYTDSGTPVYLYPDSAAMTLGDVTVGGGGAGNNPDFRIGGTTTGNSIARIINGNTWSFLYKENTGTWTLGDVTVGTLTLNAGTLVLNGTFSYTYNGFAFNGGTLKGTGTLNSAVTVPAAGIIAPGNPTGTLTVTNNNCTISGTLRITVDDAQSPKNGRFAALSGLTVTGSTLDFSVTGTPTNAYYVIATYGTLTGAFGATNNLPAGYTLNTNYNSAKQIAIVAETNAPTPDPMSFAVAPTGLNPTTIGMTATTATDTNGPVLYYFENTTNSTTSGWTNSTTWTDTGLTFGVTYGYRVRARDRFGNLTGWSPEATATPLSADSTPPTPNPMMFVVPPAALNATQIVMTATNASDPSAPVEYYFENTNNGHNSGWITSVVWTNSGLTPDQTYGFTVKARDAVGNPTAPSAVATATTPENTPPSPDPMTFAVAPASLDATRVAMTATTATDAKSPPVQYYFQNTTNLSQSGWVTATVWTNTGLTLGGTYGYRVKARDALSNETAWSAEAVATTANETAPPTPNPMTFAVAPAMLNATSILMTATTASDVLSPPVQYFFENTSNFNNSGWIAGTVWTNAGLTGNQTYGYTVKARDAVGNETDPSAVATVFLPRPAISVYWDGSTTGGTGDGASAGGSGTWSTAVTNWDQGNGQPRVGWYNGADTAIFGGTAGTVTLGESISVGGLRVSAGTFTISGNTLNFGAGGWITNAVQVTQTIRSGITGSPSVNIIDSSSAGIAFAPTNATQTLGTCTVPYEGGISDKASIEFGGTTTGNSAGKVTYQSSPLDNHWGSMFKTGSGTWAVGDVDIGTVNISAGNLVVNGTIKTYYGHFQLTGGVFHYNNPTAYALSILYGYPAGNLQMLGGSLDNSSGAAITATNNTPQNWAANWTFIGSQGAASDLNFGTAAVTLTTSPIVTVSNAATTLTVGGAITDGALVYGLTKAGAGTLRLTGSNTYNGATTVAAGTLSLTQRCLDDSAAVTISNGAVLNLDYAGTDTVFALFFDGNAAAAGTWGGPGSGAQYTTNLLSGTGMLYFSSGLAPEGTWYWDGPNYGGTGNGAVDGGSGVWSISSNNWDQGFVSRKAWNNTTNDKAIFRTVAGTVDLQSDITLGEILVDGVNNYVIGGNPETYSLNFGGAKKITLDRVTATIRAGITGSPQLLAYTDSTTPVYLYPDSASMTLGDVTIGGGGAGNNPAFTLGGSTTGNSIAKVMSGNQYSFLYKENAGTWTLGDVTAGSLTLNAGTLVLNGTFTYTYLGFYFNGGTLAGTGTLNSAVTVPVAGTNAPGNPTGTMTVTNNCTINGTLRITVDGGQSPNVSTLAVGGALTISNATLNVSAVSTPYEALVIARYGTRTGTFAVTNGLPAGYFLDYAFNGNQVALVPPRGTVFKFR